ncbi:5'/3'-nucleotidase SurE [Micromonospora sp. NPDC047074]|uniref:5'/3'-nucleotidase SurE n=1 Tax=Micromonospora sp. NPDC047074 TaxID=3154339 RepID=UPI0033E6C8B8
MRVLVTNDDGIDAPGLAVLAAALSGAGHDITVVAPIGDASGAGTGVRLTVDRPIAIRRTTVDGVTFVGVDGTPALAVMLARMGAFGAPPTCVVAGINVGSNTGRSILHSGTVGAALTGASMGMSALAVSLHARRPENLESAAQVAGLALTWLAGARKRTVLNVNVPDLPLSRLRGVRWGRLAAFSQTRATIAEVRDDEIELRLTGSTLPLDPATDAGLVENGYVVVTPLLGIQAAGDDAAATAIEAELTRRSVPIPSG